MGIYPPFSNALSYWGVHPLFCIICHPSFVSFATPYLVHLPSVHLPPQNKFSTSSRSTRYRRYKSRSRLEQRDYKNLDRDYYSYFFAEIFCAIILKHLYCFYQLHMAYIYCFEWKIRHNMYDYNWSMNCKKKKLSNLV